MGSRFIRPETTVLSISGGDTLTVKRTLSAGEQRARFARMSTSGVTGLTLNHIQIGISTLTAYLLDWTLTDDAGARVDIRGLDPVALESVLDGLDTDSFAEILAAVEAHEVAQEAEKKRIRTTASASSVTS